MLLLLQAPPMAMATRNLHATEEDMDMQACSLFVSLVADGWC
jgi:hypothetical protein